jgi:hypothetical protein
MLFLTYSGTAALTQVAKTGKELATGRVYTLLFASDPGLFSGAQINAMLDESLTADIC